MNQPSNNTGGPGGVQSVTKKYNGKMFNNTLLKNYNAAFCEITMQVSSDGVDSKLFKPAPPLPFSRSNDRVLEGFKV